MYSNLLVVFLLISSVFSKPDYVVIGGGPSGCMVANRLATYGYETVLLEQGIDEGEKLSDFPQSVQMRYADVSLLISPLARSFRTKRSQLLVNRITEFGLGWSLGGGTLVNGAITQRPFKSDYDQWVTDDEMAGWGYNAMVNYHIAMESNSQFDYSKGPYNQDKPIGGYGPIPIADEIDYDTNVDSGYAADPHNVNLYASHLADMLVATMGIPHLGHTISYLEQPIGVGYTQKVRIGGYRVTAAHALIHPLINPNLPTYNPNLQVITGAVVTKFDINIKDNGNLSKIKRVFFIYESEEDSIDAKEEFILAAGAINSPKILLLSGVGPKADLEALGFDSDDILDVPGVGINLQDHPVVPMVVEGHDEDFPNKKVDAQNMGPQSQALWFGQQAGYLSVAATPLHAYWKSSQDKEYIDSQVLLFDGVPFLTYPINNVMYPVCVNADSPSRGKVTLMSKNFQHEPVIDFGFYYDPTRPDYAQMDADFIPPGALVHIDCLFSIWRAVSASPNGLEVFAPPMSDQAWYYLSSMVRPHIEYDAQARAALVESMVNIVRSMVIPGYHPGSTLSMGPSTNPYAPVDSQLRFKQIENLRVVDTSIQPILVSSNPMLSAYAVGMKAADLIMARQAKTPKEKHDEITLEPVCNGWFTVRNSDNKDGVYGTWFLTSTDQGDNPVPDNNFDQGKFYVPADVTISIKTPLEGNTSRMMYLRLEEEKAKSSGYEMDTEYFVGPVPQVFDC